MLTNCVIGMEWVSWVVALSAETIWHLRSKSLVMLIKSSSFIQTVNTALFNSRLVFPQRYFVSADDWLKSYNFLKHKYCSSRHRNPNARISQMRGGGINEPECIVHITGKSKTVLNVERQPLSSFSYRVYVWQKRRGQIYWTRSMARYNLIALHFKNFLNPFSVYDVWMHNNFSLSHILSVVASHEISLSNRLEIHLILVFQGMMIVQFLHAQRCLNMCACFFFGTKENSSIFCCASATKSTSESSANTKTDERTWEHTE